MVGFSMWNKGGQISPSQVSPASESITKRIVCSEDFHGFGSIVDLLKKLLVDQLSGVVVWKVAGQEHFFIVHAKTIVTAPIGELSCSLTRGVREAIHAALDESHTLIDLGAKKDAGTKFGGYARPPNTIMSYENAQQVSALVMEQPSLRERFVCMTFEKPGHLLRDIPRGHSGA